METTKDEPPRTPTRERRRVKTPSLNLAGDERSNAFFGGQSNVPSSVYGTPSRRAKQPSVTCGGGDFFGDLPCLNKTPAIPGNPDESTKVARGDHITMKTEKETKAAPEQATKPPKQTVVQKNSTGSFFSGLLQKKNASNCVK